MKPQLVKPQLMLKWALALGLAPQLASAQVENFFDRPICKDVAEKAKNLEDGLKKGQASDLRPKSDDWQPYPQRFTGDYIQVARDLHIKVRLRKGENSQSLWFETTFSSICENKVLARGKRKLTAEEATPVDPDLVQKAPFTLSLTSLDESLPDGIVLAFGEKPAQQQGSRMSLSVYRNVADMNSGRVVEIFDLIPVIHD